MPNRPQAIAQRQTACHVYHMNIYKQKIHTKNKTKPGDASISNACHLIKGEESKANQDINRKGGKMKSKKLNYHVRHSIQILDNSKQRHDSLILPTTCHARWLDLHQASSFHQSLKCLGHTLYRDTVLLLQSRKSLSLISLKETLINK